MSLNSEEGALLAHVLVTRQRGLLHRAWSIIHDADAAQDLVQEATVRILAHPPRSRTEASLAGCLFRAVHNLALNERRRRTRDARCVSVVGWDVVRKYDEVLRADLVLESAIRQEEAEAVRALFRVLTLLERESVTLVHLERRTVPEAAERLGLREKAVQRALGRAHRKLWNLCAPRVQDGVDPDDVAAVLKGVHPLAPVYPVPEALSSTLARESAA